MKGILDATEHRPWQMPKGHWVMAQTWHDLLFAHWPVNAAVLRNKIPAQLEIDRFGDFAWIAVVPFRMTGVRLRGAPAVPWLSEFPELNVRTYVTSGGRPGVWFFSLDAGNFLAVEIARAWFHLPYFRARMSCHEEDGHGEDGHGEHGWIRYSSERTHGGASAAVLESNYRPIGEAFQPKPGTLEHFLTERYCLYAADGRGRIIRGEIHHLPWSLQIAEAEFSRNTMADAAGAALPAKKPLLHFARRQDVVVWAPQRIAE